MLTNEDIKLIVEGVTKAEKELFYTKPEFDEKFRKQEESFASLQTSVDGLATKFQKYYEEQTIVKHKLETIEDWIKKAATKLGLDYNP